MQVSQALQARRAVKHFDPAHDMSEAEFKQMMDLVLYSPTSFNIQNWRFVRVTDTAKREAIKAAAWDQAQITDASALIVLCADTKSWNKDTPRYWRDAPQEISDLMVSMTIPFYEGKEELQRDEAMRSVGIAAQSIMLLAKEMDYDTCPMIGFDPSVVAEVINLPDDHVIGMIVAVGKSVKDPNPRGGSIDYNEAVLNNNF